nr:DUF559 domain-containing protein [Polymorphobacter sp.]
MIITGPASTLQNARRLRSEMTLPEVLLWDRLRKSDGPRFRRQHPAGPYILDFFCAKAKLVVEIDGIVHSMGDAGSRDARRDAWLTAQGLRILRINASEVLADVNRVAASIMAMAAPLHHRKGDGPPPPKTGEDFISEAVWNT